MSARLLDQLVEAGLVTGSQMQLDNRGDGITPSARVIQTLVARGVDERTLAGFFVAKGFGPMLQAPELATADLDLVRRLGSAEAHELCAMPLRPTAAGAVVAMADPTDEVATAKLSSALGGRILPTVAKLSDLLDALDRAYPREVDHESPLRAGFEATASPVWDRAWTQARAVRDGSPTAEASRVPVPTVSATSSRAHSDRARPYLELDGLRRATNRDAAVHEACRACLQTSRGAAFLALRKGVFRGWDGVGEDVTRAGIRSLWVPASNPSRLNEVLHTGEVFRGAYGETAADHLFRAAFGANGREVIIAPVLLGTRMVGVLCANDPAGDSGTIERIAEALGQAFTRLIVSRKSGD